MRPCRRLPAVTPSSESQAPVEVAAPVCREKAVRDSDLVDGQPGVALQVQVQGLSQVDLEVASWLPSCGCPRRSWSFFS